MVVIIYGNAKGPFKARTQAGNDLNLDREFPVIRELYDHLRALGYAIEFDIKA